MEEIVLGLLSTRRLFCIIIRQQQQYNKQVHSFTRLIPHDIVKDTSVMCLLPCFQLGCEVQL